MPRSFALGQCYEAFIDEQVESGHHDNSNEVVQASLWLLEEHERQRHLQTEEIRRVINEGRRSGETVAASTVFYRLEARIKAEAGQKSS